MKTLAVLISNKGTGTNLQAIIDAIEKKILHARIAVVVADTEDAKGLERAKNHSIPIAICKRKEDLLKIICSSSEEQRDESRTIASPPYPVDYVVLAGWKQFISDAFIDAFPEKILNLHPGLIPDTLDGDVRNPDDTHALWNKGKLAEVAIENFLSQNTTYAGSSVHFLSHEFDFGKVLGRCFEKIKEDDTIDSLYSRLKVKENKLYVEVLQKLCT